MTPKAANGIAEMEDTSEIYVNTQDGYWYYYNGSEWIQGAVYQSSATTERSIKDKNIESISYNKVGVHNLLDEIVNAEQFFSGWSTHGLITKGWSEEDGYYATLTSSDPNADPIKNMGIHFGDLNRAASLDRQKDLFFYAEIENLTYNNKEVYLGAHLFNGGTYGYVLGNFGALSKANELNPGRYLLRIPWQLWTSFTNPRLILSQTSSMTDTYSLKHIIFTQEENCAEWLFKREEEISYSTLASDSGTLTYFNPLYWNFQYNGKDYIRPSQTGYNDYQLNIVDVINNPSIGLHTETLSDTSKKLYIEFDYYNQKFNSSATAEQENMDKVKISFYIANFSNNADWTFEGIKGINGDVNNRHCKIEVDLPYYTVYKNLSKYQIWMMFHYNTGEVKTSQYIGLKNFKMYYSNSADLDIYADNFEDVLTKISGNFVDIQQKIENGVSQSELYLQGIDEKYAIQVNTNGELVSIPVIPNKVVLTGNSLIGGNHFESDNGKSFGMNASNSQSDYYYLLSEFVHSTKPDAVLTKIPHGGIEGATSNASLDATVATFVNKLDGDEDLIIVQLGDNTNTEATKNTFINYGCKKFLTELRKKCPLARVVWMGVWYQGQEIIDAIAKACQETGSIFVNIKTLNTTINQSYIGAIVTADSGETRVTEAAGVASHPGDRGFKAITNKLIYTLGMTDNQEYYTLDS